MSRAETKSIIARLYKVGHREQYRYWNSRHGLLPYVVAETANKLSKMKALQVNQKRLEDGTYDYIATGLMTENQRIKAGIRQPTHPHGNRTMSRKHK